MNPFHEQFRTLQHYWTDASWLGRRMLFLSGSRQVGKTTLVTQTICRDKKGYFNWDNRRVRRLYQENPDFIAGTTAEWICFDEIHKRSKWKDMLKGIYDGFKDQYRFVITGSARLETFRKSGDSLVGRYFHTRLFPLNLSDFAKTDFKFFDDPRKLIHCAADNRDSEYLEPLLQSGGFPEPFFSGSEQFWKRWSANHRDLIIREDLRDLSKIVEIDKLEILVELIQRSIGKTVSYRNLGLDLETTHGSIRRWLETLNRVHLLFSISPYFKNLRRVYRQEKKWYYADWRAAGDNCFENYVAASLLRAITLYGDRYGERMSLHFLRTHDGAEVDFLVCLDGKPWCFFEVKEGSPDVSSAVYRFSAELNIPCCVVTRKRNICRKLKGREGQEIWLLSWGKLGPLLP